MKKILFPIISILLMCNDVLSQSEIKQELFPIEKTEYYKFYKEKTFDIFFESLKDSKSQFDQLEDNDFVGTVAYAMRNLDPNTTKTDAELFYAFVETYFMQFTPDQDAFFRTTLIRYTFELKDEILLTYFVKKFHTLYLAIDQKDNMNVFDWAIALCINDHFKGLKGEFAYFLTKFSDLMYNHHKLVARSELVYPVDSIKYSTNVRRGINKKFDLIKNKYKTWVKIHADLGTEEYVRITVNNENDFVYSSQFMVEYSLYYDGGVYNRDLSNPQKPTITNTKYTFSVPRLSCVFNEFNQVTVGFEKTSGNFEEMTTEKLDLFKYKENTEYLDYYEYKKSYKTLQEGEGNKYIDIRLASNDDAKVLYDCLLFLAESNRIFTKTTDNYFTNNKVVWWYEE
jgi:hypothetical protein